MIPILKKTVIFLLLAGSFSGASYASTNALLYCVHNQSHNDWKWAPGPTSSLVEKYKEIIYPSSSNNKIYTSIHGSAKKYPGVNQVF